MRRGIIVFLSILLLLPVLPGVGATHDPNDVFQTEATFPGITWNGVFGVGTSDVWAVGAQVSSNQPVVAKRTAGVWALQSTPVWGSPLMGMTKPWFASTTIGWAAAPVSGGNNLQRNGGSYVSGTWAEETFALTKTNSVWGFSSTDVWATGWKDNGGTSSTDSFRHWDGVSWNDCASCNPVINGQQGTLGAQFLGNVFGVASNDVWATHTVAGATTMYHFTGSSWAVASAALTFYPSALWGGAANDIWGVGFSGTFGASITHYDGAVWALAPSPTTANLNGVFGTSTSNIWAVGASGTIIHYDGAAWTTEPTTTTQNLNGVWCANASNCWAVGAGGVIQKLQILPNLASPTLGAAFTHDLALLDFHADGAKCIGGYTTFTISNQIKGAGVTLLDGDIWIYSYETNAWILDIDDSSWVPVVPGLPASQFAGARVVLPPGGYVALAIMDLTGLGAVDVFDGKPFTVSKDSCVDPDFTTIINRIDEAETNIINAINNAEPNLTYTNNLINLTSAATQLTITDAHDHIDTHFLTLYGKIFSFEANVTAKLDNLNIQCDNCSVNQSTVETLSLVELPGLSGEDVGLLLVMFVIMVMALWYAWWWIALGGTIGVLTVFMQWDIINTAGLFLLLVVLFWLETMLARRKALALPSS